MHSPEKQRWKDGERANRSRGNHETFWVGLVIVLLLYGCVHFALAWYAERNQRLISAPSKRFVRPRTFRLIEAGATGPYRFVFLQEGDTDSIWKLDGVTWKPVSKPGIHPDDVDIVVEPFGQDDPVVRENK